MRILVIGAGAMGSLLAARLTLAGAEATLFGRPSPHAAAIQQAGLQLETLDGKWRSIPIRVGTDPVVAETADLALVMVKAWATREAVAPLRPHLRPGTTVLTLQNGLGNEAAIRDMLPDQDVVAGVTSQAALRSSPGTVRHTGDGPTLIGRRSGVIDDRLRHIASTFSGAGMQTAAVADIERWIWRKLAVNAAINGPTALTGTPNGAIGADDRLRIAANILAGEVATVARALGFELGHIEELVNDTARATTGNRSSMRQDLEAGRRTEVEAIYDAVIAAGAGAGIDTPALRVVSALIHTRESAPETNGEDKTD